MLAILSKVSDSPAAFVAIKTGYSPPTLNASVEESVSSKISGVLPSSARLAELIEN